MTRLLTVFSALVLLAAIPALSLGDTTHVVRKGDTLGKIARVDPQGSTSRPDAEILPSEDGLAGTAEAAYAASPARDPATESPKTKEQMIDRLLREAHRMLSVPYRFGGTTLWGLDCSGFVQKAFAFLNRDLPRSAREQFLEGSAVEKANLSPGDLVFFRTYAKYPSHVGIYLGDNRFVHASSRLRKVTVDSLDTPYYVERYIGAKRLLFEENDVQN